VISSIITKDDILDVSLALADFASWDTLRLHDVAQELNVSLAEIQQFVREKDEVAELLFDRADLVMLNGVINNAMSTRQKLYEYICLWFDALTPYKTIVRSMLAYKLEPGHFHFQARGITRISRTTQWFMEAAGVQTKGPRRAIDEVLLTTIYLQAFMIWMLDSSAENTKTKTKLLSMLTTAEWAARKVNQFQR